MVNFVGKSGVGLFGALTGEEHPELLDEELDEELDEVLDDELDEELDEELVAQEAMESRLNATHARMFSEIMLQSSKLQTRV